MKNRIIFICGSLEPGKDGVGDYTRRLASELISVGCDVRLLALNDKHLVGSLHEVQIEKGQQINTLRLGKDLGWKERAVRAKAWVNAFNPSWLSLQYVPYAFQDKGLPFFLGRYLKEMGGDRKWHVMFHELWIGISKISPKRHKIIGYFQSLIAVSLINRLEAIEVSTSNLLYLEILRAKKIEAKELGLFSNIERFQTDVDFLNSSVYSKVGLEVNREVKPYMIGVFGTIHPEAKLEVFLNEFIENIPVAKRPVLISFGRAGERGIVELKRIENKLKKHVDFIQLGELTERKVSTVMQVLDIALSCTPAQHLGKSGVYASFRLHGVSVLSTVKEELPEYQHIIHETQTYLEEKETYMWSSGYVAGKFIEQLNLSR